ncbi:hypothetical protein FQR65_LT03392 [Abscondita terminalis]|nr:hypothetical protein FQR65_LT03392 [Abscondita terminalis]
MYMKRRIIENNNYCIQSEENEKRIDPKTPTKRKLLIVDPIELNTKLKDENHNYCITKNKYKKAPLPMKFRAFPESFWQQPNKTSLISPGNVYFSDEGTLHKDGDTTAQKTTDVEETVWNNKQEIISQPNIDLLFSLFRHVEEEEKKTLDRTNASKRRGRPKKLKVCVKVKDDDPYLTSSAADTFLPLFSEGAIIWDSRNKCRKNDHQISLATTAKASAINLLSTSNNNSNQNFSKILSDLVVKL